MKAVHIEPVSDLLRRHSWKPFDSLSSPRRSSPTMALTLSKQPRKCPLSNCSPKVPLKTRSLLTAALIVINWHISPERAAYFVGLFEAAIKAMKIHLRKVMGDTKFTFQTDHSAQSQNMMRTASNASLQGTLLLDSPWWLWRVETFKTLRSPSSKGTTCARP